MVSLKQTHRGIRLDDGAQTTIAVTLATTFAVLPPMLLGATSPLIRRDLDFSLSSLGITVAMFFIVSAIASLTGGLLVRRFGVRAAIAASSLVVLTSLLTTAFITSSWNSLAVMFPLGGVANALAQPAANQAIASAVPEARQGVAFGIKQSAIPFAALLAGLAIPTIALSLGWRATFAIAGLLSLVTLPLTFRLPRALTLSPARHESVDSQSRKRLLLLGLAFACATATASCIAVFLVAASVDHGISLHQAGLLFAFLSLLCIAGRIVYGWLADRRSAHHFRFISVLLWAGAAGIVALGFRQTPVFLLGAIVAFLGGWGWNGLFNFALVQSFPRSAAVATGVVLTGGYAGSAFGPLAFGFLVDHHSFQVAWLVIAATATVAALLMTVGGSLTHATHGGDLLMMVGSESEFP